MFKYKKLLILLSVVVMVLLLAMGCTNISKETENKSISDPNKLKVTMVTSSGEIDDESFNQIAWEGVKRAKEDLDINISYKESSEETGYIDDLEELLAGKNDLIWGIGFILGEPIKKISEKNLNQKYAIVDFSYEDYGIKTPENVLCLVFNDEHSSFMAGYIASKISQSGKIGFIGGMENIASSRFEYGYRAGIDYANKETGKNVEILVNYVNSFEDSEKGKDMAIKTYKSGADIIFQAAGNTGLGVIEAAKQEGKYVIGVDIDQSYLAPENVVTSVIKRVDLATYNVVEDVKNNEFKGGQTISYGLKEGAVDIVKTSNKHLSEDLLHKVEEIKKAIISGDIIVPFNKETYEENK